MCNSLDWCIYLYVGQSIAAIVTYLSVYTVCTLVVALLLLILGSNTAVITLYYLQLIGHIIDLSDL